MGQQYHVSSTRRYGLLWSLFVFDLWHQIIFDCTHVGFKIVNSEPQAQCGGRRQVNCIRLSENIVDDFGLMVCGFSEILSTFGIFFVNCF
jgi:hypothetical protein